MQQELEFQAQQENARQPIPNVVLPNNVARAVNNVNTAYARRIAERAQQDRQDREAINNNDVEWSVWALIWWEFTQRIKRLCCCCCGRGN